MWFDLCRSLSPILLLNILIIILENAKANEVIGCGGFLKSDVDIDFSKVEIRLVSKQGTVKDKTDCSPSNGYYFLPVYDKGDYVLQIVPPAGWSFEPAEVPFRFDGKTDICSQSKDINFRFQGFGITGQVRFDQSGLGAAGVNITLRAVDNDLTLKTITNLKGLFSFTPIIPGSYIIHASHLHWHFRANEHHVIVKKGNTELPPDQFLITGFDLLGHFKADLQQLGIKAVVALFSKQNSPIAKCQNTNQDQSMITVNHKEKTFLKDTTCYAFVQSSGEYLLPNVAPGLYLLVPTILDAKESNNLHWSPSYLEVEIVDNFKKITTKFQIEGFDVHGQILSGPSGNAVSGAIVKLNGKQMATSNAEGAFILSNIKTEGIYAIQVEAPQLQFSEERVKLKMLSSTLPSVIVPSALEVCGRVEAKHSHDVVINGIDNASFQTTVLTETETGAWCTFLPPGKYRIMVRKESIKTFKEDDKLSKEHVQFSPLEVIIDLLTEPIQVRPFTQLRIRMEGVLKCLPDAPYSACLGTEVTLNNLDLRNKVTIVKQVTTGKDGRYIFENILPGQYEIKIAPSTLCFNTTRQIISVSSALEIVPDFVQTGYEVEILSSHNSMIKYLHSTEAVVSNEIELTKGVNKFCVPRMGIYNLEVKGCHLYDSKYLPKSFNTMDKSKANINLEAIAHEVGIKILTTELLPNSSHLKLQLESSRVDKRIVTPIVENKEKINGKFVYSFRTHLTPMEKMQITPLSDLLLFEPVTKEIIGINDCVEVASTFNAVRGLIVKGRVVPAISEALITLSFPKNPELESINTFTNNEGEFNFHPIAGTIEYELTGEKESYVFGDFNRETSTFNVHKLSKIIVEVHDNSGQKLSGVLVSLSGGESYRKNLITGDDGIIYFHSLAPSQYFVRPMLKEYKFDPNSKVISVKDGETVEIKMSAKRIAYSVFGYVKSLNLSPLNHLMVEAKSNESCMHHQEEAITEANGQYRLRGLKPGCEYKILLKDTKLQRNNDDNLLTYSNSDGNNSNLNSEFIIENTVPKQHLVNVHYEDIQDINFLGLLEMTYVDVLVYVTVSANDWYKTLRLVMYEKGSEDSPLYNQRVEGPLNQKTENCPGTLMTLSQIPLDGKSYVVELRSTLSDATFKYKLPSKQFVADTTSVYVELDFRPELRSTDSEVAHGSWSALIMVTLVVVVFFKQDFALTAFWFFYENVHQLVEELLSQKQQRNGNSKVNGNNNGPNHKTIDLNQKEIEQIADQINNMKKKKTKKI